MSLFSLYAFIINHLPKIKIVSIYSQTIQATNRIHPRHIHPLHHLLNAVPPPISHSTHHLDPAARRRSRPSAETIKPALDSRKWLFGPSTASPRRRRLLFPPLIAHEGPSPGTGRSHPGPVSLQCLASVIGSDSVLYCHR